MTASVSERRRTGPGEVIPWRRIARRVIGQAPTGISADRSRWYRQIAHVPVYLR